MSNANPQLLTADQLARMTPSDVNAYISSLPANAQSYVQGLLPVAQRLRDQFFLQMTELIRAPCAAIGQVTPFSAAYAPATNMVFNLPNTSGGLLESLLFICDIAFTYTPAGGSPAIAVNAAAPFSLFDSVTLKYGNANIDFGAPFFHNLVDGMFKGWQKTSPNQVFNGPVVPDTQADINSGMTLNSGPNTWRFSFRVDRNPLHDQSIPGLLPITGNTQATVNLRTAQSIIGRDPLINTINTNGTITAVTGQVQVFAEYRDGTSLATPQPLTPPSLAGVPVFQTTMEPTLRLLAANSFNRAHIASVGQIYYMISLLIDGNQSNVFSYINQATAGVGVPGVTVPKNIQGLQISRDEAGNNPIRSYGLPTNLPVSLFWYDVRKFIGQDPIEGVIPWIVGNLQNEADPDDRQGRAIMNTTPGNWTNLYHGYNVAAIGGVAGINPRVETFVGLLNQPLAVV